MLSGVCETLLQVYNFMICNISVLLSAAIVTYLCLTYHQNGLNRYPGPFLAKFGKLWHRIDVHSNRHPYNLIDLHRRYGPVVRIGPSTLSISDPEYVPKIYGIHSGFLKSNMYDVFSPRVDGKIIPTLLSARNPLDHARLHKPVARDFAMTAISSYEPLMDMTLRKWIRCLEQNFDRDFGQVCDIASWVRFFATEAIMNMTFGESMGFLEKGEDIGGFLEAMDKNSHTSGLLCPMPWTAYLVRHNPIIAMVNKTNTIFPRWAAARIQARTSTSSSTLSMERYTSQDFLDRFLEAARKEESSARASALVMNWCLVNILAGGDTTATGLTSIVYNLLKTPVKLQKLVDELRCSVSPSIPSWDDCQALTYLDACVREGHRLHPSIALGLERDAGGLRMHDDYVLPKGVRVSMNAWVVNRQSEVFGDRVDDFIPERWIQSEGELDEDFYQRINKMKRATLNFGAGTRACTGRHLAIMETFKAVAALFRNFDITLADPSEEWVTQNGFLSRIDNVRCILRRVHE